MKTIIYPFNWNLRNSLKLKWVYIHRTGFANLGTMTIALLLLVGIGYSIWDYKKWRWEETRAFGQGPEESAKSEVLSAKLIIYQNGVVGVRIKYPEGLQINEGSRFKVQDSIKMGFENLVRMGERVEVVNFGDKVRVSVERTELGLSDASDREAGRIELTREWDYINTEKLSITILTWAEGQRALAKIGEKLIVIDSQIDQKVFFEMLKSLVPI